MKLNLSPFSPFSPQRGNRAVIAMSEIRSIHVFVPDWSVGVLNDAQILASTLSRAGLKVLIYRLPMQLLLSDAPPTDCRVAIDETADIAVFIEHIFDHPAITRYPRRAFLPNPEWFMPYERVRVPSITEIWHKSMFGLRQMAKVFPDVPHVFIGFSSVDPSLRVSDYQRFLHFRGNMATSRSTQLLIDTWLRHPEWPRLKLQAYGKERFIHFNEWISLRNLDFYFGFLDRPEYVAQLSSAGVHLCLSEVEGFGHYINEARAMAALCVTLDAPPMNELVDANSGVLVPVVGAVPMALGMRHFTNEALLGETLERVLSMPLSVRAELGAAARKRFEMERRRFQERLREVIFGGLPLARRLSPASELRR
jgi:hypothetical protein